MTNTMTYKGYAARIEYDDEDGIFTGRIAGIRDGVGFHADTVEGLRDAFHEAVEDYIETCAKIGKEPQKTYSGQVMFRVSPEVHCKAALAVVFHQDDHVAGPQRGQPMVIRSPSVYGRGYNIPQPILSSSALQGFDITFF